MLLKFLVILCYIYFAIVTESFQLKWSERFYNYNYFLKNKSLKKKIKIQKWSCNNSSYRGVEYILNKNGGEGIKNVKDKASELLLKAKYAIEINGLFHILPLGYRVIEKIKKLINKHLEKMKSHCLHLSILQNKKWWNATNRSKLYSDEFLYVYKLKRAKSENNLDNTWGGKKKKMDDDGTILSPTCEELSLVLINKLFNEQICLKNLPILIHQFNYKFRNEKRIEKSLYKSKEFLMKDGYSFHANNKCLSETYEQYKDCYNRILKSLDLNFHIIKKRKQDKMNAIESHEFQILCRDNKYKEVAHIFKLGDYYSNKLCITYLDKKNEKQLLHMGSYGIGIFRLLYFLIDHFYDTDGIRIPEEVSPFNIYLISKNQKHTSSSVKIDALLKKSANKKNEHNICLSENQKDPFSFSSSINMRDTEYVLTLWLYNILKNNHIEVYLDDTDMHISKKLKYCDLIGIPHRIIINLSNNEEKIKLPYDFYNFINIENDGNLLYMKNENILSNKLFLLFKNIMVEYKNRFSHEVKLMSVHNLLKHFKII